MISGLYGFFSILRSFTCMPAQTLNRDLTPPYMDMRCFFPHISLYPGCLGNTYNIGNIDNDDSLEGLEV
jgi:hypothetical protein